MGKNKVGIFLKTKRGYKRITNRGRFQGLQIRARKITNYSFKDFKSGQGFQIKSKRFQIEAEITNMGQRGFLFGAEITNRCRINGIYTVTNITVTNLKVYPNIYSPENIFLLKWNSTIVSQLFNNYCSKTSTVTNQRSEADTEFFPALI